MRIRRPARVIVECDVNDERFVGRFRRYCCQTRWRKAHRIARIDSIEWRLVVADGVECGVWIDGIAWGIRRNGDVGGNILIRRVLCVWRNATAF